jgi:site-specific DNA recombinase
MRTAVTYRRVSTGRQADEGDSLEAQQMALVRFCKDNGLALAGEFEDAGKSGRSLRGRPALEAALRAVCESKGVLVVYSLSRLARSIKDAAAILDRLRNCGADLAIVDMKLDTSNIYGELIFNMVASLAQFESQLIGHRTKAAHKHLKKKHGVNVLGPPPYGYQRAKGSRVVEPEPDEQKTIRKARLLRKPPYKGAPPVSYKQVARQLNELGFRTRLEGEWTEGSVWRILNPDHRPNKNAGILVGENTGEYTGE